MQATERAHMPTPEPWSRTCSDRRRIAAIESLLESARISKRRYRPRQCVFHAGQHGTALYFVHAGFFKTSLVKEDGVEKVTGFQMRGDMLGIDSLGMKTYASDVVALDVSEAWEFRFDRLGVDAPALNEPIIEILVQEIRRSWRLMASLSTLSAQQKVAAFLLDTARRHFALGFDPNNLVLRMSRAELGSFLALEMETIARTLAALQARGLLKVMRRQIQIIDAPCLSAIANGRADQPEMARRTEAISCSSKYGLGSVSIPWSAVDSSPLSPAL